MRNRTSIRSRATTGAAVTAVALALGTLGGSSAGAETVPTVAAGSTTEPAKTVKPADSGDSALGPAEPTTVAEPDPTHAPAPATTCTGTQPLGSLPEATEDSPLERTVAHADRMASDARYFAVYTGMSVASRAADIYRMPSAAFDAALCGAAEKGVTVRLHDTDVNHAELVALQRRISADMSRWDGTFQLRMVGLDVTSVVVGVDDPAVAEPILKKAFGAGHITVRVEEPVNAWLLPAD
ncbi:hypothetical protein [Streptomyces liliifuscus]|uniref:Uncharacterized protein n=1 Tax=Streptomyces liliifuscus TaxID=2797636 RepID=A0A7T7L4T3_9ACTN|nr:hypothetical protein [Streptomyces liliifuscus]QQM46354.1 hypothetical protein JEQ17_47805 [Streptomyces liliifuscus]